MDLRIIVIIASVFGLLYIFKAKNKYARIITAVGAVAIGISLIPIPEIAIDGFYIFFAFHFAAIIYVFSYDEFSNEKKTIVSIITFFSALPFISLITDYGFQAWMGLFSILPVLAFGYALKSNVQNYKNEIGFLTIMAANALVTFIVAVKFYL